MLLIFRSCITYSLLFCLKLGRKHGKPVQSGHETGERRSNGAAYDLRSDRSSRGQSSDQAQFRRLGERIRPMDGLRIVRHLPDRMVRTCRLSARRPAQPSRNRKTTHQIIQKTQTIQLNHNSEPKSETIFSIKTVLRSQFFKSYVSLFF